MEVGLSIWLSSYLILMLGYWFSWRKLHTQTPIPKVSTASGKLSVIIPVRNEAAHITQLLEELNRQTLDYSQYEVIVVDDASTDNTKCLVQGMSARVHYDLLLIDNQGLDQIRSPKKRALHHGIKKATGDVIVTTDGDCSVSPEWLNLIAQQFAKDGVHFLSMPVVFKGAQNLFERIQTVEFAGLVAAGASSLYLGFPNMCNGANLAFRKEKFQQLNGYNGNGHVASGDDEFLMHKFYRKDQHSVFFLKSFDVAVHTYAQKSLKDFWNQRKRWASKWKHYKSPSVKVIGLWLFMINLSLVIMLAGWMLGAVSLTALTIAVVLKSLVDLLFISSVLTFFNKKLHWIAFVLLEIIHPFYVILLGIVSNFGSFKWKGRVYHE